MKDHECVKEEFLGGVKEFMDSLKGFKSAIYSIVIAILIQVGSFLFLWGSLTTTVKTHDKTIEKIVYKLENMQIIGYANAEAPNGSKVH